MDPNEVRLRQARAQQTSASSAAPANSPGVNANENSPHGGDMDPNEVRLRLARMQQASGASSPVLRNPVPNNTVATHPMQRTEIQPPQNGSSSQLINTPSSPPSGFNMYQNAQSPQSTQTGQYFPPQSGLPRSSPIQVQQSPQSPHTGPYFPPQPAYPPSNPRQVQQSPQSPHTGQYFPSQPAHPPSNPIQVQQSPQSPHSGLPSQVGYCTLNVRTELTFKG